MLKNYHTNSTCVLCGKLIFFSQNLASVCNVKKIHYSLCKYNTQHSTWTCMYPGLSLSSNSPVALIFTPVANLLHVFDGWIVVSTTGQFTCNIKGPSSMLNHNRCYGLQPLLTALVPGTRLAKNAPTLNCHSWVHWDRQTQADNLKFILSMIET